MAFLDMQGELFEILEDDKCLPEEQVQAIAKQLVLSSTGASQNFFFWSLGNGLFTCFVFS